MWRACAHVCSFSSLFENKFIITKCSICRPGQIHAEYSPIACVPLAINNIVPFLSLEYETSEGQLSERVYDTLREKTVVCL